MTEFTKITLTAVFSVLGTLIVAVIIATSTGVFRKWRVLSRPEEVRRDPRQRSADGRVQRVHHGL